MNPSEKAFERYGSFHEDLIIGIEQSEKEFHLQIQRRKLADKLEDQIPIRNANLKCTGVTKVEFNQSRVLIHRDQPFTSENDVDVEIVDIVFWSNRAGIRVEVFWEGTIDDHGYRDAKFDIFAKDVSLEF